MVIEEISGAIDRTLDYLKIDPRYSEPQNVLWIISIIVSVISLLVYYFKRRKIRQLVFEGVWKKNVLVGVDYYIKVKREQGEVEHKEFKVLLESKINWN